MAAPSRFILVAVAMAVLAGCGDDAGSPTAPVPPAPAADRSTTSRDTSNRLASPTDTQRRDRPTPTDQRGTSSTKTTASGAVVILPPRPTEKSASASSGCEVKVYRQGGKVRRFFFPPSPGVAARRASDAKVVVAYQFGELDARCRPATLELTIDVNDDAVAGSQTVAPVRGSEGTLTIDVPPDLAQADVVRATARTQKGYPSKAASVLIE